MKFNLKLFVLFSMITILFYQCDTVSIQGEDVKCKIEERINDDIEWMSSDVYDYNNVTNVKVYTSFINNGGVPFCGTAVLRMYDSTGVVRMCQLCGLAGGIPVGPNGTGSFECKVLKAQIDQYKPVSFDAVFLNR
jgi:hypothetical protein